MNPAGLDDLIEDALRAGQRVTFRNRSGSMHPAIRPHDRVVIQGGAAVGQGDIALIRTAAGWTAHRVQHLHLDQVVLRADVGDQEHRVHPNEVLGRVVQVRRDSVARARGLRDHLTRVLRLLRER